MKIERPPSIDLNKYFESALKEENKSFILESDQKYFYWDDVKYRKNAPFDNPVDNWGLIKAHRFMRYERINFGYFRFCYYITPDTAKNLHDFDLKLMGDLQKDPMLKSEKLEFFKNSLLEEAVASSQVEGAATTTDVARDMLKSGRAPRNESEQMIVNNLRAINFIREFQEDDIDFKMIIELHSIMTANTEADNCSGNFRSSEVFVTDHVDGEIAHTPPDYRLVEKLMGELCDFINDDTVFIHPIIKASIIHFMIGFIHPFLDGNGRTARALFYWFLLRKGYSMIGDISISRVILESRTQYDKAFLKTEYDENDINYFISYSIKNIRVAFEKLTKYRDKKLAERQKSYAITYELIKKGLNQRQADLIGYLYWKNNSTVTLNFYAEKNNIVRQTAKKDLIELMGLNLLTENSLSKPFKYTLTGKSAVDKYLTE